jgi:hypothetical protein
MHRLCSRMSAIVPGPIASSILVALPLVCLAAPMAAQDTQYWAGAFGTQARLLGGTVIGSDPDISAVFYNPGALALEKNLQLLISLNALQYSQISYSGSGIPDKIPGSSGFSSIPNLIAGIIKIGGDSSPQRMAYSILTRQIYVFRAQIRNVPLDSFIPEPEPPPKTTGNAFANQSLGETWAGVSYATSSGNHWGFGGTMFLTIRGQAYQQTVNAQASDSAGNAAIGVKEYDFSYSNWAVLLKLGVQYKSGPWSAGLAVTTPRLDLFGGSYVGATQSFVNDGVAGAPGSQIATNYQQGLGATYHSPFSIGGGFGHHWRRTDVTVSAEWFAAVPQFTIIPAVPFVPETGGPAIPMALTAQYRSVFNWGVGVRQMLSQTFDAYGAFRTDNTSIPNGVQSVGTLINWNLLHANFGVRGRIERLSVILGFDTAWGSQQNANATGSTAPGLPTLPLINQSYLSLVGAIALSYAF